MTSIDFSKWSKGYEFVDPKTGTLAIKDNKLDTITLNIFQRIARTWFGCYANTHLKVVGNAARAALFNPNISSNPCNERIKQLAQKNFLPSNDQTVTLGEEEFMGATDRSGLKQKVVYKASFAKGGSSPLSRPCIHMFLQDILWGNYVDWEETVTLKLFKESVASNKIIINSLEKKSPIDSIIDLLHAFFTKLISSSKMDQIELVLTNEAENSRYVKSENVVSFYDYINKETTPIDLTDMHYQLNLPFSLDFLLNQSN